MFFIAFLLGFAGLMYILFHLAIFAIAFKYMKPILLAFLAAVIICGFLEVGNPSY